MNRSVRTSGHGKMKSTVFKDWLIGVSGSRNWPNEDREGDNSDNDNDDNDDDDNSDNDDY